MRVALALVIWIAIPRAADADPAGGARKGAVAKAPPAFFQRVVRQLSTAGFHRNTSETDWQEGSICQADTDKATQACQRIRQSWVTSVVADKKRGKDTIVQELWLFEFDSPDDATAAVASFSSDFRYGPFAKHPYRAFVHDRHVVVVEGRARWHTDGRRLEATIEKSLAKLARQAAD